MSVVVLLPVLGRPHRVSPVLKSIRNATRPPRRALFLCDPGDVPTQDAIARAGGEMLSPGGSYAHKINVGVRATTEPLIFLGADDLHFHPGWLDTATLRMVGGVGVVGTNDLGNQRVVAGEHATHSLIARWYAELGTIDEPEQLLHEGYHHNFVDDELIGTAKARGAWAFAHDSIVEHLHPLWGKADDDEVYRQGRERFRSDQRRHHRRRALWT